MFTYPQMVGEGFIEELVDDTLAGTEDLLPPEVLEDMRWLLGVTLASHPVASELVNELRERPPQENSGAVGDDASEDDSVRGKLA